MQQGTEFLPVSRQEMAARGWDELDFVLVTGDAYVDHPSFGSAIIGRVLEAEGYRVGVLSQPDYTSARELQGSGQAPLWLFHRRRQCGQHGGPLFRGEDPPKRGRVHPRRQGGQAPGPQRHRIHSAGKAGLSRPAGDSGRPGGQPAPVCPLRLLDGHRAAQHRSRTSGADLLSFGMGEHQTVEIARRLAAGEQSETITDVRRHLLH